MKHGWYFYKGVQNEKTWVNLILLGEWWEIESILFFWKDDWLEEGSLRVCLVEEKMGREKLKHGNQCMYLD
jgi:hypothetical protein